MTTRQHRRRDARRTAKAERRIVPDADYATVAGWCAAESDLPEAKKGTHDTLIALMGDDRTGGVQWRWWTGDEAVEALRTLREGATGEYADHYRRIGGHLREYGGYLVVALAPGRPRP